MFQSVEGIYKKGKIELLEIPNDIEESQVIITFLETKTVSKKTKMMSFGMFTGANQSRYEDFLLAEFKEDLDDNLDWS